MEKELQELKEKVTNLGKKIDESIGSITDLNQKTLETFTSMTNRIDRLEDQFSKQSSIGLSLNLAHLKQLIKYATLTLSSEEKEHFFSEIWEDFVKSVKSVKPNVTRKELMTMKKTWDTFRKNCVKTLKYKMGSNLQNTIEKEVSPTLLKAMTGGNNSLVRAHFEFNGEFNTSMSTLPVWPPTWVPPRVYGLISDLP